MPSEASSARWNKLRKRGLTVGYFSFFAFSISLEVFYERKLFYFVNKSKVPVPTKKRGLRHILNSNQLDFSKDLKPGTEAQQGQSVKSCSWSQQTEAQILYDWPIINCSLFSFICTSRFAVESFFLRLFSGKILELQRRWRICGGNEFMTQKQSCWVTQFIRNEGRAWIRSVFSRLS